jgi:hypothetical protein
MSPPETLRLDDVARPDGTPHAIAASDLDRAFPAGADLDATWLRVRTPHAALVIAATTLPGAASDCQPDISGATLGPSVRDGVTMVPPAACDTAPAPRNVISDAISRVGLVPRLALGLAFCLAGLLAPSTASDSPLRGASSASESVDQHSGHLRSIAGARHLQLEANP